MDIYFFLSCFFFLLIKLSFAFHGRYLSASISNKISSNTESCWERKIKHRQLLNKFSQFCCNINHKNIKQWWSSMKHSSSKTLSIKHRRSSTVCSLFQSKHSTLNCWERICFLIVQEEQRKKQFLCLFFYLLVVVMFFCLFSGFVFIE